MQQHKAAGVRQPPDAEHCARLRTPGLTLQLTQFEVSDTALFNGDDSETHRYKHRNVNLLY